MNFDTIIKEILAELCNNTRNLDCHTYRRNDIGNRFSAFPIDGYLSAIEHLRQEGLVEHMGNDCYKITIKGSIYYKKEIDLDERIEKLEKRVTSLEQQLPKKEA